jgi:hypothetical protein
MKKELILAEIYRQNKQWKEQGGFFSDLKTIRHKRKLFFELRSYLEKRQIISIVGLRRTGKTILLKQLMRHIMQKNSAKNILFLTFDEAIFPKGVTLANYINAYLEEIAPKDRPLFIFLDEIQYAAKWQHIIKRYWDTEPGIKFIISGSSSLFLRKKTTESLAGRIYEFTLSILSFEEYLEFRPASPPLLSGYKKYSCRIDEEISDTGERRDFIRQYGKELEKEFENYLRFGQFPEIVGETDRNISRKYFTDAIYRKTIEYDIPKIFGTEKTDELKFLFQILAAETGSVVEIGNIAREVGIDEKTIKKYIGYFEESFLVFLVYNLTKSIRKSRRVLKKVYLGSTNFFSAFHDWPDGEISSQREGLLAENYCLLILRNYFEYIFFYRVRSAEIDFVAANDRQDRRGRKYFEVKYRNNFSERDYRFLVKTARENGTAYRIVSKNKFVSGPGYSIIPIWLLK